MLTPNQIIHLSVEKPAAGGRMIAHYDGQVVLTGGAIPGERVTARVERIGKGVAFAHAVSIEEASPDRRESFSDPSCGGCVYSHIAYPRQIAIKAQVISDGLTRIGRLPWSVPIRVAPSPDEGYRMRARLHIRNGRIGFFREGSHDVCEARPTRQLLAASCEVLDRMAAAIKPSAIVSGELELAENVNASHRAIHLETAERINPDSLDGLARMEGLTGLVLSDRSSPAGPHSSVAAGDPHVTDVLAIADRKVVLRRHVLAFFQANRFLLQDLLTSVVARISPNDDVIDLYAGTGPFAIAAAVVRDARVTAVEGDRDAAADLLENARACEGTVDVVHQPVEAFVAQPRRPPSVLIVDPPRTGMSKESLEGAIRLGAGTVLYVSCDVATFARDVRRLVDAAYSLEHLEAFDLFPNTPHVETVAVFRRT